MTFTNCIKGFGTSLGTVILSLCIMQPASSQPHEKNFVLYSQADGLSNNNITGITQDKRGYLWISTIKGLNRYNGSEFAQFHADTNSNSLPMEEINHLQWLDSNSLSALTLGLHIIDTRTNNTRNIIIPPGELKYAFKVNFLMAVHSNKKGDIFLLTRSGFYHYSNSDQLIFRFDYYNKEQAENTPFQYGSSLFAITEVKMLVKAKDGIYIYDSDRQSLKKITGNDYPLFKEFADVDPTAFLIKQSEPGRLIVFKTYSDTAIYIDVKRNLKVINKLNLNPLSKEIRYQSTLHKINDSMYYLTSAINGFFELIIDHPSGKIALNTRKYFPNYFCSSVFKDTESRLWIGTNKGLYKEKNNRSLVHSIELPPDNSKKFPAPVISQVFVFKDKLYIASRREGGLLVLDKYSLTVLHRINFSGHFTLSNNVYSISHSSGDTLLIGTNGPLFWLKTSTGQFGEVKLKNWNKNYQWVAAQLKDSNGDIWVSSNQNTIYKYLASTKQFESFEPPKGVFNKILVPLLIQEDAEKNIWMAGHGLTRFNKLTGRFDILLDSFPNIRFPRKEIDALEIDKSNNIIWFGNYQNGLISYSLSTKVFRQFTHHQGLPDDLISALQIVKNKLWIGTPGGIASLDLHNGKIAAYGSDDGFPATPLTGRSFFYDSASNELYIGFDNYLVRFNPDSLIEQNEAPRFFIENIQFSGNNSIFYPGESVTTSYFNNNFSITIGSINYRDVNNQQFLYRLLTNKDSSWKILPLPQSINFNNISPGTYQLQVKLIAANNRWPEQVKTMHIVITPPFWQTTWFRILAGSMVLALIIFFYRIRIRRIHYKANIDKQLAEYEMKALHTQMNPHFVFNCLNSIKEMILHNEQAEASRYLSKFALLIRTTLEHSGESLVTLQHTIEYLKKYIEMEKIRFSHFNYEIKVDPLLDTEEVMLPPLLIQPLVENAIWHGLTLQKNAKFLSLRFQKKQDYLLCEIEDNGVGVDASRKARAISGMNHNSYGIKNIEKRISLINEKYNMSCTLHIVDRSSGVPGTTGTIVSLLTPLKLDTLFHKN